MNLTSISSDIPLGSMVTHIYIIYYTRNIKLIQIIYPLRALDLHPQAGRNIRRLRKPVDG